MNTYTLLFGFQMGLCATLAFYFISTPQRRAPYRRAFGWLMVSYCFVLATHALLDMNFRFSYDANADTFHALEMVVIPFFMLEVLSIIHQDVQSVPWGQRWAMCMLFEVPILTLLVVTFFVKSPKLLVAELLLFGLYTVVAFVYLVYKMRQHRRHIEHLSDRRRVSLTWMWYIFAYALAQAFLYITIAVGYFDSLYLLVTSLLIVSHGYLIFQQAPLGKYKLPEAESAAPERAVLPLVPKPEAEPAAELPSLRDMEGHTAAFLTAHPGFESRLRALSTSKLTRRDLFLCLLIAEGKRIPIVAKYMAISESSVEVARYRLRSKLNLTKADNLNQVLQALARETAAS